MTPKHLAEIKKKPEDILLKAVSGMIPKNNLRRARLRRLKIFQGEEHPYMDQLSAEARKEFENREAREFPAPKNATQWPKGPVVEVDVGPEERAWAEAEQARREKLGAELESQGTDPFATLPEGEFGQFIDDTSNSLPFLTLEEAEAKGADMLFLVKRLPNNYWDMFPDFKARHPEWFGPDGKKKKDL